MVGGLSRVFVFPLATLWSGQQRGLKRDPTERTHEHSDCYFSCSFFIYRYNDWSLAFWGKEQPNTKAKVKICGTLNHTRNKTAKTAYNIFI